MAKNPFQGDDQDDFEAARDTEGNIKQTGLAPSAKLSNFGAAFNAARKSGQKTFEFKGKKYTTEMAKPAAKPAKPAKPAEKGPDTATLDRLAAKQADEAKGPSDADLDRMKRKFDTRAGEKGRDPSRYGKPVTLDELGFKKGGSVKVSGASKRADGIALRGKTRGKMV
jgi:hypothetical protein